MIALLQRTCAASVFIDEELVARIDHGVLVFLAVQKHDDKVAAARLCERVLNYRIFADKNGKMNKNVIDVRGGVLVVPQFTLAANTGKGLRPSFSSVASPEQGKFLFDYFLGEMRSEYATVKAGRFGADMQVQLINDGPVTFWLQL